MGGGSPMKPTGYALTSRCCSPPDTHEYAIIHQGRLDPGVEFIAKPFTSAALVAKTRQVMREVVG